MVYYMTYINKLILDSVEKTIKLEFDWLNDNYQNETSVDKSIITYYQRTIESALTHMRNELEGDYE